jgi:ATP-dependent Lon protease
VAADAAYVGRIAAKDVPDFLGPARFRSDGGVPTLAAREWRPASRGRKSAGDVLYIEAVLLPGGNGHLTLTGQLGSVMQNPRGPR